MHEDEYYDDILRGYERRIKRWDAVIYALMCTPVVMAIVVIAIRLLNPQVNG